MISMWTEETIIGNKSRWADIAYFHVVVDRYRGEPATPSFPSIFRSGLGAVQLAEGHYRRLS